MEQPFGGDFRWENLSEEEKQEMRALMRAHLTEPDLKVEQLNRGYESCEPVSAEYRQIRLTMAINPNTPAPLLHKLAGCGDPTVQERVAENIRAHAATLTYLAGHPDVDVRSAVAENSNTPIPVLKQLALDENPDVRYRLAENHNTPVELLRSLSEDHNPYVSCRAQRTLARLLQEDALRGNILSELDPLRRNAGGA